MAVRAPFSKREESVENKKIADAQKAATKPKGKAKEKAKVKAQKAKEYYSITSPTLRAWSDNGKIRSQQQPSGSYQYWINAEKKKVNNKNTGKYTIIYTRVSYKKQSGDLKRQ